MRREVAMFKGFKVKKVALLADPRSPEAAGRMHQVEGEVRARLEDLEIECESYFGMAARDIQPGSKVDLFLVLGGDGTMICYAGPLAHLKIPFFGLNYGNVGFMMNSLEEGLLAILLKLRNGRFRLWEFPLLEVAATDLNGMVHHGLGLNDIYLQRMTAQTCRIDMRIKGQPLAFNPILCDGVIVSTPLGSTAYSFNATGSVVSIDCPVLTVTPLAANRTCPIKSLMLPMDSAIAIEVLEPLKRRVSVVSDGQDQGDISQVEIRLSKRSVRLGFLSGSRENFPLRLINKCRT